MHVPANAMQERSKESRCEATDNTEISDGQLSSVLDIKVSYIGHVGSWATGEGAVVGVRTLRALSRA